MGRCFLIFLLVLAFSHGATSRNAPQDHVSVTAAAAAPLADEKNFLPCIPKQPKSDEQLFVHATAPLAASSVGLAESPGSGSMGIKDKKNFIYGGIGGFAGMGGYGGIIGGGIPVLGGGSGLGSGIGGAAGMGGGISGIGLPTCP